MDCPRCGHQIRNNTCTSCNAVFVRLRGRAIIRGKAIEKLKKERKLLEEERN